MAEQPTAEQVKSMEELVSFLSHPRPELRKSASSLLINMTASDQGMFQLLQLNKFDVVQALCRVVSDMRPIAEDAIKSLINLTAANPGACERTLKYDLLNRVMTQVEDDEWRLTDYSMMLLANVTTTPEGAKALLGYDEKHTDASIALREKKIRTLTNSFLQGEPEPDGVDSTTGEPKWDDEYQYVANILANISQLEQGRDFLLKMRQSTSLAGALLTQLKSPNAVRRRGVTAALKNLCFDTDNHFYLYDQLDIPTHMMYLLAGPEELDEDDKMGMNPIVYSQGNKKKREKDRLVRLAAVDCLLLLCTTRNGRKELRRKKVYPIIREAHLVEPDEEIGDQIYKLVDFLIRDEEGEEPDWDEVRTKSFAAEQETKTNENGEKVLPPIPAPAPVKAIEESKKEPEPETKAKKPKAIERKPVTASSFLPTSGEDEEVSEDIADQFANEISALDVSSDEEDEEEDDLGVD
uniref:Protein HGH1 homolog n=1 Tax=Phytophthora ramorum TaxID=164328 RepID=H3GFD9_PHYRM